MRLTAVAASGYRNSGGFGGRAKQSQKAVAGSQGAGSQLQKQSQFVPRVGCASAPNKPNLGPGKTQGNPRANKELRRMGCGSSPGKTKPISAAVPIGTSAFPGGERAKQSQFLDCGLRIRYRPLAERLARSLPPPACGVQNAQNEPNFRPSARVEAWGVGTVGDCAKQSQFPPEQSERQVSCGKGVMVNHTCRGLQQNKANFGDLAGTWNAQHSTIPAFQLHADCAKQSQFPGSAGRAEAPGAWDASQMCETYPIWAAPTVATAHDSTLPAEVLESSGPPATIHRDRFPMPEMVMK